MGLKINSSSEILGYGGIVSLIYGPPGSWKTTLAMSAEDTILYDFDGGSHRTDPMHRCEAIVKKKNLNNWPEFLEFIFSDESKKYKNHVIDTAGTLVDSCSNYLMSKNRSYKTVDGSLTMKGWGAMKVEFQKLERIAKERRFNLTFTAHDAETNNDENEKIRPDVAGGSLKILQRMCDLIGHIEQDGKKRVLMLETEGNGRIWGKRPSNFPKSIEIPDLYSEPERMPLQEIFDMYGEREQEIIDKMNEFRELIENEKKKISSIENVKDASEYAEHAKKIDHILNSKKAISLAFSKRIKEIGVKYDNSKKEFVKVEEE